MEIKKKREKIEGILEDVEDVRWEITAEMAINRKDNLEKLSKKLVQKAEAAKKEIDKLIPKPKRKPKKKPLRKNKNAK